MRAPSPRFVLVGALRALAPTHREAVVRVRAVGQAGEDVAAQPGVPRVPRGTVKSRIDHSVRAVRGELARLGIRGAAA